MPREPHEPLPRHVDRHSGPEPEERSCPYYWGVHSQGCLLLEGHEGAHRYAIGHDYLSRMMKDAEDGGRIESQSSISTWATDTFGPVSSNARVAARANEEMAELLRALTADDRSPKAGEEMADVLIVLYRLAERLGMDIHKEVDRKMAINRAREWKLDATGHGYHVREKKT